MKYLALLVNHLLKRKLPAKQKIDDIYNKIINESADFSEMAKQYSDDKNNSSKGGVLLGLDQIKWLQLTKTLLFFE